MLEDPNGDVIGVLSRDVDVRVLNCSPSGCLLETKARLEIGTVGSLTLIVDGHELLDHLVIVRCEPKPGAGSVYHVGAQFLWLGSLTRHTLRGALGRPRERVPTIHPVAATSAT